MSGKVNPKAAASVSDKPYYGISCPDCQSPAKVMHTYQAVGRHTDSEAPAVSEGASVFDDGEDQEMTPSPSVPPVQKTDLGK